ncbi:hypothetical protein [Bradyrhizobium sp.]|uniref:hypothetical protein n=1 Tax=Bradyrhizobium sp. TaxID=376 RepID=UPI0025B8B22F|nr:hypothetical protein [Bradyrhizobium sp.]
MRALAVIIVALVLAGCQHRDVFDRMNPPPKVKAAAKPKPAPQPIGAIGCKPRITGLSLVGC